MMPNLVRAILTDVQARYARRSSWRGRVSRSSPVITTNSPVHPEVASSGALVLFFIIAYHLCYVVGVEELSKSLATGCGC